MDIKVVCVACPPSSSSDVVDPDYPQWLHLNSIINRFWEDHIYSLYSNTH